GFGHSDLHAPDIVAVPDWLQKRIGKAEVEQILHWFLAEVMIDPENLRFLKGLVENSVEGLRGGKIATKRLFDDYTTALVTACICQAFDDSRKHRWRDGKIIKRARRPAERRSQVTESLLGVV